MAEVNEKQFEVLVKILRSKDPAKKAARMVLVDGRAIKDAVAETRMHQPSVSKTVKRFREKHRMIVSAYVLTE